jgi:hypothetical protein
MTAPAARSCRATNASFGGIDVVLDEHRDAVQRPARGARLPLGVQAVGDGEGVGIHLEDVVERRPLPVERLDAGEVLLHERSDGLLPGIEALAKVGNGQLLEVKGGNRGIC